LFWPSLVLRNLGDAFLVLFGIIQSIFKLIFWRPDVVFTKGGYVCLPVGVAAHLLRIPLVIHDSDAHPGLTNRVLSRWATSIATGAPLEYYSYPATKAKYVGIPTRAGFKPVSPREQESLKTEWGVAADRPLIVVTGGGLGAKRINDTVIESLKALEKLGSVILVAGAGQYDELRALVPTDSTKFQLYPFVNNMDSLLGAADVVVTRAGATTILELAAMAKPTILVPNAKLTGGHQVKNAEVYSATDAVIVVNEEAMMNDRSLLTKAVKTIVDDPHQAKKMATRFHKFARPNAANDVATMIIDAVS
jgi:UDP-N-acetylglucosamine--N-acetylmuramyl-(pentapeptide) pyrophosphoryl-undecaprenol N-acetylglucosamine transferase